ncbi:DUF3040 domain-containing protein [Nocardioides sp. zg-1308]|uniref:DUF3040 domain-containing protein n=1 Tax=Nocardioides renjunii TaxID=3095075 RepID=A0ABU5KFM4_9ACTN|nr:MULTISPECIES: DUF3040 domain-containing protein [unclassified Nocardioides]MDZ5663763.1 DUF3040 domain-containing protein [Nocardioides sp. S-58]NPD06808.1 DUF3040 domain-containing protein [Nocardioides sp. zg-1308]WQQ20845.1 DUF3040 domain-containing protein [Nocardioides sp. S-34]
MELSEEELRLLEQMERALVEEDPKLASTLRGTSFQRMARRRMILGGAILLVGIGLLIVAVLLDLTAVLQTVVGVLGFVVMLGGAILALTSARSPGHSVPKVRASGKSGLGVVDGGRPHRPSRQRSGSPFMERMEERWRRRRERGL